MIATEGGNSKIENLLLLLRFALRKSFIRFFKRFFDESLHVYMDQDEQERKSLSQLIVMLDRQCRLSIYLIREYREKKCYKKLSVVRKSFCLQLFMISWRVIDSSVTCTKFFIEFQMVDGLVKFTM